MFICLLYVYYYMFICLLLYVYYMFIICLYVYYYVYFIIMLEARAATYDYKELNEFITIVKKDYLPECICRTIL